MSDQDHVALNRSGVLNFVYKERPKYLALAWSALGDCRAAEQVFQELVSAVDEQRGDFGFLGALEAWCWQAFSNRCSNLSAIGDHRRLLLPKTILDRLDRELRARDIDEISDQAEALRPCIGLLAHRPRWVVQFFYVEGRSGLEAARMLNVKPATLYRELQRIYTSLSRCTKRRVAMGRIPRADSTPRDVDFERLVFRYLDDEITNEDVERLACELQSDLDRVHQFNDIRIYSALVRENDSIGLTRDLKPGPPSPEYPAQRGRTRAWALSILTSTIIVSFFAGIFSRIKVEDKIAGADERAAAPATFVRGAGARFSGQAMPLFGDPFDPGTYTLSHGTAQLQFGTGASVNIEAPAEFTIDSDKEVSLHQGTVLATVPSPTEGFVVDTKFATIKDLGSEFGVKVDPNVSTEVIVFDGSVEVTSEGEVHSKLIEIGKGLRVSELQTTELIASREAWAYPDELSTADPSSSPDNLLKNPSFESGHRSRAPHSGDRYRDVPTCWIQGRFKNGKWSESVHETSAGTVVPRTNASQLPSLPHGERCLYLKKASVRQLLGTLEEHQYTRYKLTLRVAAPDSSKTAECEVGLATESSWITSERKSLPSGSEFTEFQFEFTVPPSAGQKGDPIYVAFSAPSGTLYFDDLRLVEAK